MKKMIIFSMFTIAIQGLSAEMDMDKHIEKILNELSELRQYYILSRIDIKRLEQKSAKQRKEFEYRVKNTQSMLKQQLSYNVQKQVNALSLQQKKSLKIIHQKLQSLQSRRKPQNKRWRRDREVYDRQFRLQLEPIIRKSFVNILQKSPYLLQPEEQNYYRYPSQKNFPWLGLHQWIWESPSASYSYSHSSPGSWNGSNDWKGGWSGDKSSGSK